MSVIESFSNSVRGAQFVRFPIFLLIKLLSEKKQFCQKNLFLFHLFLKFLDVLTSFYDFLCNDKVKLWPNLKCTMSKLSFDIQFAYFYKNY
jgi:hypothetical protein